jgi:hypothetical protein
VNWVPHKVDSPMVVQVVLGSHNFKLAEVAERPNSSADSASSSWNG